MILNYPSDTAQNANLTAVDPIDLFEAYQLQQFLVLQNTNKNIP